MLSKIIIKNLAIIREAEIDFASGLNVITGETGAGKSMLIDAMDLISGGRARTELIREGEEFCEVQGLFDVDALTVDIKEKLKNSDIQVDDELIIRRVVHKNGKSRAYINTVLVTQGYLEGLGRSLVSVLSQHEHHSLFNSEFQLELLDRFLNNQAKLEELSEAYDDWKQLQKKYDSLKLAQDDYLKRLDYLKYQINEIREHNLESGEEEELNEIVMKADNAVLVLKTLYKTRDISSYSEDSMSIKLSSMTSELLKIKDIEPAVEGVLEKLSDAIQELDDMAKEADQIAKAYDFDQEELEDKRLRLSEIRRLKKKFSVDSLEALLATCEEMEEELSSLENLEDNLLRLENDIDKAKQKYFNLASELSELRKSNSGKLSSQIELTLGQLGLFKGGFHINFFKSEPSIRGVDRVEYLISTNPGEPPKPISKIASGGEMSRLMLSIQTATNKVYGYGIQIFDEVDPGIGGDIAFKVGGLLKMLATSCQVIVITHLPQIAVFASRHVKVWKEEFEARTRVFVRGLEKTTVFNEVSRMLGMENHGAAVNNAKEMISKAKKHCQEELKLSN